MEQADDFYEYYTAPNPKITPKDQKNLLFIYAESLEKTYFDNELFKDLTPSLSALIKDENGIEFTNIVQTTGSNYTIAGITSTQCGIPLFTTSGGNSMEGVEKFYQEALCLGDILKKSKSIILYHKKFLTMMLGCHEDFLFEHLYEKMKRYRNFKNHYLISTNHKFIWNIKKHLFIDYGEFMYYCCTKDKLKMISHDKLFRFFRSYSCMQNLVLNFLNIL
jgi:hypothetical protein